MDKQIKAPIGIKIIAAIMFIGSLCVAFWYTIAPFLIPVIISLLFVIGSIGLWKTKKGIKSIINIVAVMMFVGSLCVAFWFKVYPELISNLIPIIISFLFIIGGIGLWKMKRWGLLVSYLALSGVIFLSTKLAIICVIHKEFPGIITDNYLSEMMFHCGPPFFVAISILYYLWRKRRCFYE